MLAPLGLVFFISARIKGRTHPIIDAVEVDGHERPPEGSITD
jgi:hypothetical protein